MFKGMPIVCAIKLSITDVVQMHSGSPPLGSLMVRQVQMSKVRERRQEDFEVDTSVDLPKGQCVHEGETTVDLLVVDTPQISTPNSELLQRVPERCEEVEEDGRSFHPIEP